MTNGAPFQTVYEGTITFAAVAANTTADQTVTLTSPASFAGAYGNGGAAIHLELKDLQAGLTFCNAHAASATTFVVRFTNTTGGSLTPTGTNAKLIQF